MYGSPRNADCVNLRNNHLTSTPELEITNRRGERAAFSVADFASGLLENLAAGYRYAGSRLKPIAWKNITKGWSK